MKIISFNVNGIRAIVRKSFIEDIRQLDVDVICLQETKATVAQTKEVLSNFEDYAIYGNEAQRKGYSGTAILTRREPISVFYEMGIEQHDREGRITGLEFENFYLITVYVPNSGSELLRLEYRQKWDADLLHFLKGLEQTKPVVVCGDFNVAHQPIDLARPKENYNKSAGYMQAEIDGMDSYLANGFVDVFRRLNDDTIKYTWWSYRGGARQRNVGWRIDYFLVSDRFLPNVKNATILNEIHGSDHCPVQIEINTNGYF